MFSDDYDTSEKCRAPAYTDRVLYKRRKQSFDVTGFTENWSYGQLVYYGRVELKQSDHRPIIAIVDINSRRIDEDKRENVFYEVIADMGPPDGTIIVHCEGIDDTEDTNVFDDYLVMALLEDFTQFGDTILVRFVADTMWITFRDGQSVLEIMKKTDGKITVSILIK